MNKLLIAGVIGVVAIGGYFLVKKYSKQPAIGDKDIEATLDTGNTITIPKDIVGKKFKTPTGGTVVGTQGNTYTLPDDLVGQTFNVPVTGGAVVAHSFSGAINGSFRNY